MNKGLPTITEGIEELRQMLRREGNSRKKQRLQALYLLQTRQASSRKEVARLLGINRDTIGRWLSDYSSGGVSVLLDLYRTVGKKSTIYGQILEGLQQKFYCPYGFGSYDEIRVWLYQLNKLTVH